MFIRFAAEIAKCLITKKAEVPQTALRMLRSIYGIKVKITLKQTTKGQRGSRCIALLFFQPRP